MSRENFIYKQNLLNKELVGLGRGKKYMTGYSLLKRNTLIGINCYAVLIDKAKFETHFRQKLVFR